MLFANNDQQNKYYQIWKEILKIINGGNGELEYDRIDVSEGIDI